MDKLDDKFWIDQGYTFVDGVYKNYDTCVQVLGVTFRWKTSVSWSVNT